MEKPSCAWGPKKTQDAEAQAPAPSGGWGGGKTLAQRLAEKDSASAAAAAEAKREAAAKAAADDQMREEERNRREAAAAAAHEKEKRESEEELLALKGRMEAEAADSAAAAAVQQSSAQVPDPTDAADAGKKKKKNKGKKPKDKLAGNDAAVVEDGTARPSSSSSMEKWSVKLDILCENKTLEQALDERTKELERRTRRNLRGFPESGNSAIIRPAALLRQGSRVDLAEELSCWRSLPSVVTWLSLHPPSPVGLEGFAAFAAAADFSDDDALDASPKEASSKQDVDGERSSRPPATLDDFELMRLVGAGGFGKVYQVRKKSSGRVLALKAMRKHLVIEELNVEGTKNERSVLETIQRSVFAALSFSIGTNVHETIQHPFIVRLHCAFHDTGRLYLLMDWHNGGHFLRLLNEKSPLSEDETRFYLAELVLAIEGLHEHGIVHRDLKPENVLLDCLGHLVVTDFGASKIVTLDRSHEDFADGDIRTNSWVGTELYMAPEQLLGLVYGRVVDWWAIGVLAYEMLAGSNPFYHDNPEQVAAKVQRKKLTYSKHLSGPCVSLLKGLLTREPDRRLGKGGPEQIKKHAFFQQKGFKWQAILDRELTPPFQFGTAEDIESATRVHERYANVTPCLSPLEMSSLSPKSQDLFKGFDWVSPYYSPAIHHTRTPASPLAFKLDDSPSRASRSPADSCSPHRADACHKSPATELQQMRAATDACHGSSSPCQGSCKTPTLPRSPIAATELQHSCNRAAPTRSNPASVAPAARSSPATELQQSCNRAATELQQSSSSPAKSPCVSPFLRKAVANAAELPPLALPQPVLGPNRP